MADLDLSWVADSAEPLYVARCADGSVLVVSDRGRVPLAVRLVVEDGRVYANGAFYDFGDGYPAVLAVLDFAEGDGLPGPIPPERFGYMPADAG